MDQVSREVASPTTAEIRAQIAQTRTALSGTIECIQERFSPASLVSHAKGALASGQASQAVLGVARRMPRRRVPVALLAAAAAALGILARRRSSRGHAGPSPSFSAPGGRKTSAFVTALGTGLALWNALNPKPVLPGIGRRLR